MSLFKTAIAVFALLASLTCTGVAGAAPYIPPGNSAATQYTEAIPTAGGNVEVNADIGDVKRAATKALGKKTVRALAEQGQEGAAVAALAAGAGAAAGVAGSGVAGSEGGGGSGADRPGGSAADGGKSGDARGGDGTDGGPLRSGSGGSGSAGDQADGSSGFGEVVSQATFSSSGEMGVFLPLVLLAALIWALLFAWRRRERSPTP